MKDTAVIISSGSISDYRFYSAYLEQAGFIACADAGAMHARNMGVVPHLVIGDFDSVPDEDLSYFADKGVPMVRLPSEKDITDTEAAMDEAVARGYGKIVFMGCIGTRMDHTLGNINLLKKLHDKGIKGIIIDEHNEIELISGHASLESVPAGVHVSLLPLTGKAEGVTTGGLYYPLSDAVLELGDTIGISNEICGRPAEVSLKRGLLLVIKTRD